MLLETHDREKLDAVLNAPVELGRPRQPRKRLSSEDARRMAAELEREEAVGVV